MIHPIHASDEVWYVFDEGFVSLTNHERRRDGADINRRADDPNCPVLVHTERILVRTLGSSIQVFLRQDLLRFP